jgi:hypothetical protein
MMVGNGEKGKFWTLPWLDGGWLKDIAPSPLQKEKKERIGQARMHLKTTFGSTNSASNKGSMSITSKNLSLCRN